MATCLFVIRLIMIRPPFLLWFRWLTYLQYLS